MLKQSLQQKLQQKLSPQQIQLMKLIQLPTLSFEQKVKEELEINPALEDAAAESDFSDDPYADLDKSEDDYGDDPYEFDVDNYLTQDETPDYKYNTGQGYSDDDDDWESPLPVGYTLHEQLLSQFHVYQTTPEEFMVGDFLIGSIDEDGYIRRPLKSLRDDMVFTLGLDVDLEVLEHVLVDFIQKLDPLGVGARDLQETLIIQLEGKEKTKAVDLAIEIVEHHFDAFSKKHYKKLLGKLKLSEDELRDAVNEIERLNPRPGKAYASDQSKVSYVVPDFTIKEENGELELLLNGRNAPNLKVSNQFTNILEGYKESKDKSREQKDAALFVKQKLDAAKWFIDAIKQRQNTMYVTMEVIMDIQREYFLSGDEQDIKPMILKDVADKTGLDISTISRVANSKYVSTPYGTKLIKDLFSESVVTTSGEEVSTIEVKNYLKDAIENEDKRKPLTDDKLTSILKEKGYNIARRTVSKYREQLDIPVARLRKSLN